MWKLFNPYLRISKKYSFYNNLINSFFIGGVLSSLFCSYLTTDINLYLLLNLLGFILLLILFTITVGTVHFYALKKKERRVV